MPRLFGARAPDCVDEGKIGGDEFVAAHHGDAGVEMLGELDGLLFKRVGTEHVGRRVDEITPVSDRLRDALNPDRVDLVGRDEARLGRLVGLEAVIAIEREQEAERREIGVLRRVGEPVDAFGQRRRELAGGERIARRRLRFVNPEQDAGERAGLAREKLHAPAFRLKAAAFGEGRGGRADRRFDRRPVFRADQPHRRRVGRWRSECEQGLQASIGQCLKAA